MSGVRDWVTAEQDLIECFRLLGFKAKLRANWPDKTEKNGDWFVSPGPELNVSDVARMWASLPSA